jgi:hypothetical protein
MQASSANATAAIEGHEAQDVLRCTITWPGNVYPNATATIVDHELEADWVSDMPEATRDPVGYQTRKLSLTLDGMVDPTDETKTIGWLLNPFNAASPLYRKDVRGSRVFFEQGTPVPGSATPEFFAQFTGSVDDLVMNDDGSAQLECLDRMSDLRAQLTLPAVITAAPFNANLTSEAGRDAVLRGASNGTVSSWPARRPQAIHGVGMRSSLWPEVGSLDTTYLILPPTFAPGAWGTAYAGSQPATDPSGNFWVGPAYQLDTSTWPLTTKLAFEATVTGVGTTGLNASFRYGLPYLLSHIAGQPFLHSVHGLTVDVDDTGINVATTAGSDFWTITLDSSPHTLLFWASVSGGTITCHAKIDGGATHNFTGITFTDDMSTWTNALCFEAGDTTVEAWQSSTETAPTTSYPFTPQAVLDPSPNQMQVIPAVDGAPKDILAEIDAAELAASGFDELGIYRSRSRIARRGGTALRTVRSDSSFKTATMELTGAGFANRIQVPYTSWVFGAAAHVWELETVKKIAKRGGVLSMTVTTDVLVCNLDTTVTKLADGALGATTSSFRASLDQYGVAEHPGGLVFSIVQLTSTTIRITVRNPTSQDAWLVAPSNYTDVTAHPVGSPLFWITGQPVTPGETGTTDSQWPPPAEGGAAASARGEIPYAFPENAWRQDGDSSQLLGDDTLCDLRRPRPIFTDVDIVPDPRLQLGDRIHLYAPHLYLDDDVVIFGLKTSSAAGSVTQSIDVFLVASPGTWILGQPGRDELGISTFV